MMDDDDDYYYSVGNNSIACSLFFLLCIVFFFSFVMFEIFIDDKTIMKQGVVMHEIVMKATQKN